MTAPSPPRRRESGSELPHRLSVGQTVRLIGGFQTSQKVFLITARLPPNNGSPQYRIRDQSEGFERMATEANLEPLAAPDEAPAVPE